jgi:hypothetical protein
VSDILTSTHPWRGQHCERPSRAHIRSAVLVWPPMIGITPPHHTIHACGCPRPIHHVGDFEAMVARRNTRWSWHRSYTYSYNPPPLRASTIRPPLTATPCIPHTSQPHHIFRQCPRFRAPVRMSRAAQSMKREHGQWGQVRLRSSVQHSELFFIGGNVGLI